MTAPIYHAKDAHGHELDITPQDPEGTSLAFIGVYSEYRTGAEYSTFDLDTPAAGKQLAAAVLRGVGLTAEADALLCDEHILEIRGNDYGLQHPITCRPNLIECPVHLQMGMLDAPPAPTGSYVVSLDVEGRKGLWLSVVGE